MSANDSLGEEVPSWSSGIGAVRVRMGGSGLLSEFGKVRCAGVTKVRQLAHLDGEDALKELAFRLLAARPLDWGHGRREPHGIHPMH